MCLDLAAGAAKAIPHLQKGRLVRGKLTEDQASVLAPKTKTIADGIANPPLS
jgi:hypothetical protein